MRLLYAPGACSISPHIVLEEIGEAFDTQRVEILEGETRSEQFLRINPKGKVPILVLDDGAVVTETPIILLHLARSFPAKGLLPADPRDKLETLELCTYISGTLHGLGLSRIFRPRAFCCEPDQTEKVRAEGERILQRGFELVASKLGEREQLYERLSIADAALFYLELHASRLGIAAPVAIGRHFNSMLARTSVRAVLRREGLDDAAQIAKSGKRREPSLDRPPRP